jgi:hypothetical protein
VTSAPGRPTTVGGPRDALLMPQQPPQRPPITTVTSGAELVRWYWLASELRELARATGVRTTGGKQELTARLVAALDGSADPSGPRARRPERGRARSDLVEPLTTATLIPPGQRCTQQLRRFFVAQLGAGFRFDETMRHFIAEGAGRTLGDATEHWRATRHAPRREIAPQFELNRFQRLWHAANPSGGHAECIAAWRDHRSKPVDQRPPARG